MKKFTFLMLFFVSATFGVMAQTITQSNTQTISEGDWITCQNTEISLDNNAYRSFVLADFGIVTPWTVSAVEIGVDKLIGPGGGYPVTVTIYTTDAAFPTGNLTELATSTLMLPDLNLEIYSFPIVAAVPAGAEMVVEVAFLGDAVTSFLLGCNLDGQTDPWYLMAPDCGAATPTDVNDFGLPNAFVLNVVGSPGDAVSNPSDCGLMIPITDNDCPNNDTTNIAVSGVPGGVMGDNLLLTDVNLIIMHTWDGDLEVKLQSPSGVMVDLSIGNGSSGDNMGDTLAPDCQNIMNLNMGAATAIGDGAAPFIGSFVPDGDFADFNDGGDANGLWSLHICDAAGGDVGTLEYVELVFAQPCPDPSDLVATNVTDATADLGWTENGSATDWEVEVVLAGDAPTGVGTATMANPYGATGLSGSTDYEFYVRADCGGGEMSSWIGPGSFTTSLGVLTNPSACGLGLLLSDANCPDNDAFGIEVTGAAGPLTSVDLIIAHTWDADLEIRLMSPGGTTVDLFLNHGGSDDNIGDPNDANCEAVMNLNMGAGTAVGDGVAPFIGSFIPDGNLADLDDGGGYDGIWSLLICDAAGGDQGTLMYVALGFSADCAAPSNLSAGGITPTSADLGWDDNAGASEWEVEVLAAGAVPAGSGTVTGSNPYTASGLSDDTAYDFYVRAVCAPGNESDWAGPFTFTTAVDAISELEFDKNVGVYPNPVSSLLTVEVNADLAAGSVISLVSLQGKVIYNETVQNSVSEYRTEIDMTSFAKGIYILKLEDENSSIQKRIVLQ